MLYLLPLSCIAAMVNPIYGFAVLIGAIIVQAKEKSSR